MILKSPEFQQHPTGLVRAFRSAAGKFWLALRWPGPSLISSATRRAPGVRRRRWRARARVMMANGTGIQMERTDVGGNYGGWLRLAGCGWRRCESAMQAAFSAPHRATSSPYHVACGFRKDQRSRTGSAVGGGINGAGLWRTPSPTVTGRLKRLPAPTLP